MRGIVLGNVKYSDNSNVVTIFMEQDGLQSFIAHRGKGRNRLHAVIFNTPCSIVDVEYISRPGKQIQYFKEIKIAHPLNSIISSPQKTIIAMFIAEVMKHALKGERDNRELFQFICQSILHLDSEDVDTDDFTPMFLIKMLSYLGYDLKYYDDNSPLTDTTQKTNLLRKVVDIYRQHIPAFPEPKSLEMMAILNS